METLVRSTLSALARAGPDQAASIFSLSKISEQLQRSNSIDFKIANLEGQEDFADIERFIRSVLKLQQFRMQHAAHLFKDTNNNVIAQYVEVFGYLSRCEAAMRGVGFFKAIVGQCKRDMKIYWKLPVQSL